jgi:hypothetical protein
MLPILRQRIITAVAIALGALAWLSVRGSLQADDASAGISLFDAHVGPIAAVLLLLAAGLPAVLLGTLTSAWGHPLTGVFAVAVSLCIVAGAGGGIDGFLWRQTLPGGYANLLAESILWLAALAGLLVLVQRLRGPIRRRLPNLATEQHLGGKMKLRLPDSTSIVAGLVTAGIGALLANFLLQSTAVGQVIGSLILAFLIAALLGQIIIPQANPVGILLSPLIVAAATYAYVVFFGGYRGDAAVLAAWYHGELPGLALALPIYYASAGVAGSALGIGMAQAFEHARPRATEDSAG